jgi:hypothetical protein
VSTTFEFDTEIYLPVRLEFTLDPEGEIELVSLTPLVNFLPGCPIDPSALPVRERRVLIAEAAHVAESEEEAAELDRKLSSRASKRSLRG